MSIYIYIYICVAEYIFLLPNQRAVGFYSKNTLSIQEKRQKQTGKEQIHTARRHSNTSSKQETQQKEEGNNKNNTPRGEINETIQILKRLSYKN